MNAETAKLKAEIQLLKRRIRLARLALQKACDAPTWDECYWRAQTASSALKAPKRKAGK